MRSTPPQIRSKQRKSSRTEMRRKEKQPNCAYSCADICWSESRHALIFKRRHTQHKSSASCGPVNGVQDPPHTPHRLTAIGRSCSIDFFAISRISGEMMGSALVFFFILAFTIEQLRSAQPSHPYDVALRQHASNFTRLRCRRGVNFI